ncbi:hypothetical protein GWI34_25515 [Actinomadura sp. DSM 109109]|nr:hypothetical protein [Actinomadura lepetitiana]
MTVENVRAPLVRVGLEPRVSDLAGGGGAWGSDEYVTEVVLGTDPSAGKVVPSGSTVKVFTAGKEELSFYEKHKTMPRLAGRNLDAASVLDPVIWTVEENWVRRDASLPLSTAKVIKQRPAPGAPLKLGQAITLTVVHNYPGGDLPRAAHGRGGIHFDFDQPRFCSRTRWC